MDSRIRANPSKSFEVFLELVYQPSGDHLLIKKYPEEFDDSKFLRDVSRFAFPYGEIPESSVVDHFTFVLTDAESKFRFGFCRHSSDTKTCLCIISFLPWYEVFYKLLNQLAEVFNRGNSPNTGFSLLQALYTKRVFGGATNITVGLSPSDASQKFSFTPPSTQQLPSIPQSRNLTEYFNAIDADNMITIYASLMQERRVLVVSRKLGRLTACIQAAASLIYPMFWQHLYIPVLPNMLLDHCSAPMPYIIGVHSSLLEKLRPQEIGDAVILDADNNRVQSEYNDVGDLPSDVVSVLRKSLKSGKSGGNNLIGDGVARAFLRATVALIGGYRDALVFDFNKPVTFSEDRFVESRPPKMQNFLRKMLRLQIFEMFIAERLAMLNNMEEPNDEFEKEVAETGDKWNPKSRYQELLGDMKTRFQRDGKDKIMSLKHKVRVQGKKAVTDVSSKVEKVAKDDNDFKGLTRNRPGTVPKNDGKSIFYEKDDKGAVVQYRRKNSANRNSSFRRAQDNQIEVKRKSGATRRSNRMSFDDMDMPKLNLDLSTDPDMAVYMKKRSMENLHEGETDDDEDDDEEEYSDDDAGDSYVTIGDETDVPPGSEQQAAVHQQHNLSELLVPLDIAQSPATLHQSTSQPQLLTSSSSLAVQRGASPLLSSSSHSIDLSTTSSVSGSQLQGSESRTNILNPSGSSSQSSLTVFTVGKEKAQPVHSLIVTVPRPTEQPPAQPSNVVMRRSGVLSQYGSQPGSVSEASRTPLHRESSIVSRDSTGAVLAHRSQYAMEDVTPLASGASLQQPSPNRGSVRPSSSIGHDLLEFDPLQNNNVATHGGKHADEPALLQDWKAEHFSSKISLPPVQPGGIQANASSPTPFRGSPAPAAMHTTGIRPQAAAARPIAPMSYSPHPSTYSRSTFVPLLSIPGANVRVPLQTMSPAPSTNVSAAFDPFEAVHNQANMHLSSASQLSATGLSAGASLPMTSAGHSFQPRILAHTGSVGMTSASGMRMQGQGQHVLSSRSLAGNVRPMGGPVTPVNMPVIGGQVRTSLIGADTAHGNRAHRPPNAGYIPPDNAAGKHWQTFD